MSILLVSVLVVLSIVVIIWLTSKLKLAAFLSLFLVSLALSLAVLPGKTLVSVLQQGFGNTMASIGLLIIFGGVIGIALDRTGATLSIARFILSLTGEKRSVQALGLTGFITGLPIFCDAGFIVLSGLAKSLSHRTKVAMPLMATVLGCSLYSVHCLIPPHPGALAASGVIGANVGYLILTGILFAVPGALAAWFWSRLMCRGRNYQPAVASAEMEQQENSALPTAFVSLLPVVVPLLLISLRSVALMIDKDQVHVLTRILNTGGNPVLALFTGAILALLLMREKTVSSVNSVFSEAVVKAGPILIVTAAGGMFGMVIQSTGIGDALGKALAGTTIGLLVPFLIAAAMKTAQGSSTVAIITTASFVSPMLAALGLDSEWGRIFVMLSMGAGSMLVSHANDSYFWVITNFSEIDTSATLRVYTTSTIIMGTVVFACVWLAAHFML